MWGAEKEQEEEGVGDGWGGEEKMRVRGKIEEPKKKCSDRAGGGCGRREACQYPAEQKVNDIKAETLDILIPRGSCFSEDSNDV